MSGTSALPTDFCFRFGQGGTNETILVQRCFSPVVHVLRSGGHQLSATEPRETADSFTAGEGKVGRADIQRQLPTLSHATDGYFSKNYGYRNHAHEDSCATFSGGPATSTQISRALAVQIIFRTKLLKEE